MKKTLCIAAILALSATTVPALAAPEKKACLQIGRIDNWNAPNSRTVIVSTSNRTKYKLDLMGSCSGINFRETVAFKAFGGSSLSCLTSGDSILYRNDVGSVGRCPIQSITVYTPEMEKADKLARQQAREARRNAQ